MSTSNIDTAITELNRLTATPEVALGVLEKLEEQRRQTAFVKYWTPFDYQKKVFQAFDKDTKILVVCGGNRSGKTEIGAALTVAFAEGKSYFEGEPAWSWAGNLPIPEGKVARNIWIVGLDFNVLRDVIWREKLLTGAAHPGFVPKDQTVSNIRADDKQIFFSNQAIITGKSADSGREKFQSASVDLVWIDEECEAEIFDECYQRTVDCGGRIIVTVTPLTDISSGLKEPWVYHLFEQMKEGRKDIKFVYLSVLDNPVVPEDEKAKLKAKWEGHVEERARLYGEFIRRSGLVYPMWNRKQHLVPPTRPDERWMRVVSIDPAATGITAAIWAAVDPAGNLILYREYYESNLVVFDHVNNIKLLTGDDERIDVWLIDPKWGTQRNAETHKTGQQLYRDAGLPVRLAVVNEDFGMQSSMEYLQATTIPNARHPHVKVCNNLENFQFEIEHYTWDSFQKGPLKGLTKGKPMKKNDHLMNAFQYLCAMKPRASMRTQKVYSDEELKRRASTNSYY